MPIETEPTDHNQAPSISELQEQRMVFVPNKPEPKSRLLALIQRIPFLRGFLEGVANSREAGTVLAQVQSAVAGTVESLATGLQISNIGLLGLNFLRIPAIYLAAAILGEKVPITLTKTGRWLYTAVALGLTITAFALPVVAAPIGITVAALSLVDSVYALGKLFYTRYQNKKKLQKTEFEIMTLSKDLAFWHQKTRQSELNIAEALKSHNPSAEAMFRKQLKQAELEFNHCHTKLQTLHDNRASLKLELDKSNISSVVTRCVVIGIASCALAGVILTLVFPPAGIALLAASAATGAILLGIQLVSNFFKNKVTPNTAKPKKVESPSNKLENKDELSPKDILERDKKNQELNSSAETIKLLEKNEDKSAERREQKILEKEALVQAKQKQLSALAKLKPEPTLEETKKNEPTAPQPKPSGEE